MSTRQTSDAPSPKPKRKRPSRANPDTPLYMRGVLNRFADHLADGLTITEAANKMGATQQAGSKWLAHIRRDLGWQAI